MRVYVVTTVALEGEEMQVLAVLSDEDKAEEYCRDYNEVDDTMFAVYEPFVVQE